jgi:hypothetical protein
MDEQARALLHANRYLVLGTASADGRPWVSPLWFAVAAPDELLWVSSPDATHSRNLAARPEVSLVVFDSRVEPGGAQALYMTARAGQVGEAELERGIEAFSRGSLAQGLAAWTLAGVTDDARHRLYRAIVTASWVLGPGDERIPLD